MVKKVSPIKHGRVGATLLLRLYQLMNRRVSNGALLLMLFSAQLLIGCTDERAKPDAAIPDQVIELDRSTTLSASSLGEGDALRSQLNDRTFLNHFSPRQDEECCSDPGAIAECWWMDAQKDGAACSNNNDCSGGFECDTTVTVNGAAPPNSWGLCGCAEDTDCVGDVVDGVQLYGVCTDGLCGPSFCNGYQVCSCWGGCADANTGDYDDPENMCADTSAGYPGECCEGTYPSSLSGQVMGFCSGSCDGGFGVGGQACTTVADCTDPLPDPYSSDCMHYVCDQGTCRLDYVNQGGSCASNVQGSGPYWGNDVRDEVGGNLSCFVGVCDTVGVCNADPTGAEGLECDDNDLNDCTDEICVAGVCDHDPTDHIGDDCNNDDNACTLDSCAADGACEVGPTKNCDDSNYCTGDDTCTDLDPNHIVATCVNDPLEDGNAIHHGYVDNLDCSDLMCSGGIEVPTPTVCTTLNDDCNTYACVDGNGEDNCTVTFTDYLGNSCDDGDDCTVGDRCVNGGGVGLCQATGPMDCDDGETCTTDTCNAGSCNNSPNTGDSCEDGDPCTVNDTCNSSGTCDSGADKDCSHLNGQCTTGVCNGLSGICEPDHLASGEICDADSNPCTVGDACDGSGNCIAGSLKNCSSLDDQCNEGACDTDNGLCVKDPTPKEGAVCDADSSLCTPTDTCVAGTCVADPSPVDCSSYNDQCNVSSCTASTGNCDYHNATIVDDSCNLDNDGCTNETCQGDPVGDQALTCTALSTNTCDDGNTCTGGTCVSDDHETWHCEYPSLPDTTLCSLDGVGCTFNDHCDGSGSCVAGTTITAAMCEAEKVAADAAFDLDCNTAACVSTGDNTYRCDAVANTTSPGDCNADNNGCTLDTCVDFDTTDGATCSVGDDYNDTCDDSNTQCQTSTCDDGGNDYNYSCTLTYETTGTSCNNDSDGCTVNDACNGSGGCVKGADAVCTSGDPCIDSTCNSTGDNTYECVDAAIGNCCSDDADCVGQVTCGSSATCSWPSCNAGVCECAVADSGTDCTDELTETTYPANCYEGLCDGSGTCTPTVLALDDIPNNLCSDLFDPSDASTLDTTGEGYLGALSQADGDGTYLYATGSTQCSENNYRGNSDNNCVEHTTGDNLGANGNDAVYSFTYQNESPGSTEQYAYVVKVEADFDAAVYAQNEITHAGYCPEGNNPGSDDPSTCGGITQQIWWDEPGAEVTDIPTGTTPDESFILNSFASAPGMDTEYGQQVLGYLTAPTDGDYTFWIVSNDQSELYLSSDDTAGNKALIAELKPVLNECVGYAASGGYNTCPAQKSAAINLAAGQRYYIEALHKQDATTDLLEVWWSKPGEGTSEPSEVIPGTVLSQWDGGGTVNAVTRLGSWKSVADSTSLNFGAAPVGDNRYLVVGIQVEITTGSLSVTDVTYGGVSGTRVSTLIAGTSSYKNVSDVWVFDESEIAAQTGGVITATFSGTVSSMTMHAGMYANVDQTTPLTGSPVDAIDHGSAAVTADNAAVVGSAVVAFASTGNQTSASWATGVVEQTDLQSPLANSTTGSAADMLVTVDSTVNCRPTWSSQNRATLTSIELAPTSAPPPPTTISCVKEPSWECTYPYDETPTAIVIEEMCDNSGNILAGQDCCDPCTAGASCGYKWCERGYDLDGSTCDICTTGDCDAVWSYPEDMYDCSPNKPGDAGYSGYTNISTTVIYPSTNDGQWKNAIVYVDGSNGDLGNFYITVEKHLLTAGPCERVNDDARIPDITDAGSGISFEATIDNFVNSDHTGTDTNCGLYDCDDGFDGVSSCHSGTADAFWPAEAYYSIYRESFEGSATYCVTTSEPSVNGLDAVLVVESSAGATDICTEDYTTVDCAHANYRGSDAQIEFTANIETQYRVGVSRYTAPPNRPCLNAQGDDCDYNLSVIEGPCPADCVDVTSWYAGHVNSTPVTVNGSTFPTTYAHPFSGEHYVHLIEGDTTDTGRANDFDQGTGWDGNDEIWQLDYTGASPQTIYFSGCSYGGHGAFDGHVALYDCRGTLLMTNDDGCGVGGMSAFDYEMTADEAPYYLVVDGDDADDEGPYGIALYLAGTCTDGLQNGSETDVDCGGSTCPACPPTCTDGVMNGDEENVDCGGSTCPACPSSCTDGVQNGDETGVDCGGSCPACGCGAGACEVNADCGAGTPWCDTEVLDANGCGVCRSYFIQCNSADPNVQMDVDASHGQEMNIPLNQGCINMDMTNDQEDFNNVRHINRTVKLQNKSPAVSGTCTFPYLVHYTTTYCKSIGGAEILDVAYDMSQVMTGCDSWGEIRGTYTMETWWDDLQIPVRRYATAMDLQFVGSDDCVMEMVVWYDQNWGSTTPSAITCPTTLGSGVTCDPDPPRN